MPLLLSPHRLITDHIIIESLLTVKTIGKIDFVTEELNSSVLKKQYPDLNKNGQEALAWFNKDGIHYIRQEIKKTFGLKRSGTDFTVYGYQAMLRRIHELLLRINPYTDTLKWYHKIKTGKNNFKITPCTFSTVRPSLNLEVIKKEGQFGLAVSISINKHSTPLNAFNRTHYLLEHREVYFLLSYKDYQTLEWISTHLTGHSWSNQQEFADRILLKLDEGYSISRNNLFDETIINEKPANRVMLSEISNSFLVMTPQWLYDGFLVEGAWKERMETVRDGKTFTILRHKEKENKLRMQVEALHTNFSRQMNGYYYLPFADAQKKQWFAKAYHQLLDQDTEITGMDMLQHFRYSSHRINTTSTIHESENDLLRIDIKISFGAEEVALQELQKIIYAGQKAVLLKDGSLGLLTDEWLEKYGRLIKHGRVDHKTLLIGRWMALGGFADSEKTMLKKEWWAKWEHWQSPSETILYPLPMNVQIRAIRPYQQKGYEWMRLLAEAGCSGCLADDMGLGKTVQAICFVASRIELNELAKHLIVCPSSLIYNWYEEFTKFAPGVNKRIYHGAARDITNILATETQVIITSYGTMRSDIEHLRLLLFDTAVIDESHNIKNPAALTTRAINEINAKVRLALSGTPVMNNTFDLYGQLGFLLPGMLGSREFFKREYADPIDRERDPEKIQALQKLTAPFILRRTKEQVAPDLPEKTETILWCEMDTGQRFLYEEIKETIKENLFLEIKDKGLNTGKLSVLHGIMKLRQVCNSSELVKNNYTANTESVKTKVLIQELNNISSNHKALVFSQFTSMLDLLEKDLNKNGIAYLRLDGGTLVPRRQELVNEFNSPDSPSKVFLLSLKAGNAGLNLTAADYVFLFDPWWNRAVEQQAIDRTHRIGQTKNVFAYKMICRNTIEEKIILLQQRKNSLSEELIGGEEDGFVKNLTEEDLEFLFS